MLAAIARSRMSASFRRRYNACMSSETVNPIPDSDIGEPAWEVATLFPPQGSWTEAEYFALETSRFVELVNGRLEVLSMPTWLHQLIVKYLAGELDKWVTANAAGTVLFAPIPVRLFEGTIREPDVLYFRPENRPADGKYPNAVDLVMEVVSESSSDRKRDFEDKRADYAKAGVAEYWIVDPQERRINVLTLDGDEYREGGVYVEGEAYSELLSGFRVSTNDVFAFLDDV